jgi:hypothetical protein
MFTFEFFINKKVKQNPLLWEDYDPYHPRTINDVVEKNFDYGLISPNRNIYVCGFQEHQDFLKKIKEFKEQQAEYEEKTNKPIDDYDKEYPYFWSIENGWARWCIARYVKPYVLDISATKATCVKNYDFFKRLADALDYPVNFSLYVDEI